MNRLAYGLLWFQVFILPWELFRTFQETPYLPRIGSLGRIVGFVLLPLVFLDILDRGGRVRPLGLFHVVTVGFVWWAGMSLFWSLDPEETWEKPWTYTQLAVFTWLIWELARTEARQLGLLQAYVIGAYVSAFDTVAKFLHGSLSHPARFAATGFNPNDLGFTLVLALPMAWYLALVRRGKLVTWLNLLYLPLGMGAVLLTASRGAFIPAVVSLLIMPWTLSKHSWPMRAAICGLVLASALVLNSIIPVYSWERLAAATSEIETGEFSDRARIWQAGLTLFQQHPVAGVGAGAFSAGVEPLLGDRRAPHQTFLSVLVGQGLIGLLLFVAMFVVAVAPVSRMPGITRTFWTVILLTLAIGLQPRTWDYRKPLWFLLGVLVAQAAATVYGRAEDRVVEPDRTRPKLSSRKGRSHALVPGRSSATRRRPEKVGLWPC